MTISEQQMYWCVRNAASFEIFKSSYNALVAAIGNRVALEFDHPVYDFDMAEAALIEADDGGEEAAEGIAYFERYEIGLRKRYTAQAGGVPI